MTQRDQVGRWIETLGQRIGTPLCLQDDGVCGIGFGEGQVCVIEVPEEKGPVVFHASVVELGGRDREPLYRQALKKNLYGLGTAGGALALDEQADRLVLCLSRGVGTFDETSFCAIVAAMVSAAARLKMELAGFRSDDPLAGSEVAAESPMFGIRV